MQITVSVEQLLKHDRKLVMIGLLAVSVMSWGWIVSGAGMGMSGLEMTRRSLLGMGMMMTPAWNPGYIVLMFFMWWIMMIAMMLPSATPVILLTAAINRRSDSNRQPFGSAAAFTFGYLLAWAAFSILAVAGQWALQKAGMLSGILQSSNVYLSAALLIAAGGWQFTQMKYTCLNHCRAPVEFLSQHSRKGNSGALLMGAHHGSYCLGCCWFLMVLLFVGGVMNLLWITVLAIYVWVEKVLPSGETVSRVMGGMLIGWGLGIVLAPLLK